MNDLGGKEEYFKTLGLTTVSPEAKARMQAANNNNNKSKHQFVDPSHNNNNNNNATQQRKRVSRKRSSTTFGSGGAKKNVSHFLNSEQIKLQRGKDTIATELESTNAAKSKFSTIIPGNNSGSMIMTSSTTAVVNPPKRVSLSSATLAPMAQKNVVFMPPNQSQNGGILLGQTIFQSPDGKKYVLVPSSSPRQQSCAKPSLSLPLPRTQARASILPIAGAGKGDVTTPSYIYLPTAPQSHVASKVFGSFGNNSATTGASLSSILHSNYSVNGKNSEKHYASVKSGDIAIQGGDDSTSSNNIVHLLNMTRSALNDAKLPMTSSALNLRICPNNNNNVTASRATSQSMNLTIIQQNRPFSLSKPVGFTASKTCNDPGVKEQIAPVSSCVPSAPSRIEGDVLPTAVNIDTTPSSLHDENRVEQLIINASDSQSVKKSETMTETTSDCLVASVQDGIALSMVQLVDANMNTSDSIDAPANASIDAPADAIPESAALTGSDSVLKDTDSVLSVDGPGTNAIGSVLDQDSLIPQPSCNITPAPLSSLDAANSRNTKAIANGKYIGDPSRNVTNEETNCVVIQGKSKKKRGKKKDATDHLHYRRYGGPPFTPCKAPPAPNTASSSKCCLYEHTLLKMATRGFWGNEMGKLQDVFRSIRCESIDLDTVEDVTKRCYGFVRKKLIDADDERKHMYHYMKNYIDEFDSFLERVYPVALIATLIYLPTAIDYSFVTWHGIPPTGWSEYRRAVVMREVFEVLYRFGRQFNMIPEYEKAFFDSPVKCPLLSQGVSGGKKDVSSPTTKRVIEKVKPWCPNGKENAALSSPSSSTLMTNVNGNEVSNSSIEMPADHKKPFVHDNNGFSFNTGHKTESDHHNASLRSSSTEKEMENYDKAFEAVQTKRMKDENSGVAHEFADASSIETCSDRLEVVDEKLPSLTRNKSPCHLIDAAPSEMKSPVFNKCANYKTYGDVSNAIDESNNSILDDIDDNIARKDDTVVSKDATKISQDTTLSSNDVTVSSNGGMISARFAESIVAACGNMTEPSLGDELVEESLRNKRRASKRLASVSQKFDNYLSITDETKLEKYLKKALKVSKQEYMSTKDTCSESEKCASSQERVPLIINCSEAYANGHDNTVSPEHDGSGRSDSPVKVIPMLNRSVAFEALWTQRSVEEPFVILLDKTKCKLGEYLEMFPLETHCPPEKTEMIVCNQKYNAKEILGYLRRGTQLVEQHGDDVIVDTTRTVKTNSVILAVRKVPPGKISKLVHPDLHLETYTGFLLPIGMEQPVKSKRHASRSAKAKRRASTTQSKDDVICKSEPMSPMAYCNHTFASSSKVESEDSSSSPPPNKICRVDPLLERQTCYDHLMIGTAQALDDKACHVSTKETQTEEQTSTIQDVNMNTIRPHSVTTVEDLERLLNSALQNVMSSCLVSDGNNTETPASNCFGNLIDSYERAGNFLISTAKTLRSTQEALTLKSTRVYNSDIHLKDSS
eukprot:gene8849-9797_t